MLWKAIGVAALAISVWLLSTELRNLSLDDVSARLVAMPPMTWILAGGATLGAYVLLGFYDRLALVYLGRRVNPFFVHVCAAATYAFAHLIGASVFSGAVIRYRAYSSKGLSPPEIATLVAFCAVTFCLGVVTVLGSVLVLQPFIVDRFLDTMPLDLTSGTGKLLIGAVILYLVVALLPIRAVRLRSMTLVYPTPRIALLQVVVASTEIIAAALVLYVALPAPFNPGFVIVTGVFVLSFAAALLSHAPGGLGVFELAFLTGLSDVPETDVLAALLVFRLYYFIFPFIFSVVVIAVFELRNRGAD
ncbi:lysylphosphatidylglycerol synthase domain-containing protein [Rhizobium tibeticum]|uniref:lysylphosphatidylglycerol synthase domain-containing protein n=1 Tax=Rhizobium tibeticum TaxID=501024 RepID=UPI0027D7D66A|nr:lysylphosphatidylglycerol synthase domain-containing protein [Rhizobium tibeticum]